MEYPELKKYLDDLSLLNEEKEMWLELGFYITVTGLYAAIVDSNGNTSTISREMGYNIRQSIINRRQSNIKKSKDSELISTNYTELDSLDIQRQV